MARFCIFFLSLANFSKDRFTVKVIVGLLLEITDIMYIEYTQCTSVSLVCVFILGYEQYCLYIFPVYFHVYLHPLAVTYVEVFMFGGCMGFTPFVL